MYAEKTSVPIERSQAEIRKILARYSATGFAFGEQEKFHMVMFELKKRRIKIAIPMPDRPTNGFRYQSEEDRHNQRIRAKWRCLVLAIKAKLECVESGITTLEQEFLAHIVMPDGLTVGHHVLPSIDHAYKTGNMPPLLGPGVGT